MPFDLMIVLEFGPHSLSCAPSSPSRNREAESVLAIIPTGREAVGFSVVVFPGRLLEKQDRVDVLASRADPLAKDDALSLKIFERPPNGGFVPEPMSWPSTRWMD